MESFDGAVYESVEYGAHDIERLKKHILSLSEEKRDWEVARKEWIQWRHTASEQGTMTCPCGYAPIINLCFIKNTINHKETFVGCVCYHKFSGFDVLRVAACLKRIRKDLSKAANEELIKLSLDVGVIDAGESAFLMATKDQRKFSGDDLLKRRNINRKILRFNDRKDYGPDESADAAEMARKQEKSSYLIDRMNKMLLNRTWTKRAGV